MSLPNASSTPPTTSPAGKGSDSFVHLHVHTEYSMLDGAARIGDLFAEAAEMGMPALATTDHGYVFGAYEFWKKAQGTGVKPIIGVEAYVTPGTHRTDKTRVKWGDERSSRRRRLRLGRLHPHDPAGPRQRPACTTCSGWPRRPRSRARSTPSRGSTASCSTATARA